MEPDPALKVEFLGSYSMQATHCLERSAIKNMYVCTSIYVYHLHKTRNMIIILIIMIIVVGYAIYIYIYVSNMFIPEVFIHYSSHVMPIKHMD